MSFRTAVTLGLSALRSVRYLLGGHVRFPQTRLGNVLEMTDGDTFIVYRETALQSTHASAPDDGVVLVFRMQVPGREAGETLREVLFDPFANVATPFFAGMPGFERKLWLAGERPGEFLELYEWATIEDANRFINVLGSLLEPFDFAGTASFEIVEDDTIDEYVDAHAVSWRDQDRDDTPRRKRARGTSIWTVALVATTLFVAGYLAWKYSRNSEPGSVATEQTKVE